MTIRKGEQKTQFLNPFLDNYENASWQSPPPEGLGKYRTTFPQDLTHLYDYLVAIVSRLTWRTSDGGRTQKLAQLEADTAKDRDAIFNIVLCQYDIRKTEDFQEMKDTAGRTKESFEELLRLLYPDWDRSDLREKKFNENPLAFLIDSIIAMMYFIEEMRDNGHSPPNVWFGDKELPTEEARALWNAIQENADAAFKAKQEEAAAERASIRKDRNTFPIDLKHLHTLLTSLLSERDIQIALLKYGVNHCEVQKKRESPSKLMRAFQVIQSYTVRDPADYEAMKDTAGLTEQSFKELRDKLYSEGRDKGLVHWMYCLWRDIEYVEDQLRQIVRMRDSGMAAPEPEIYDIVEIKPKGKSKERQEEEGDDDKIGVDSEPESIADSTDEMIQHSVTPASPEDRLEGVKRGEGVTVYYDEEGFDGYYREMVDKLEKRKEKTAEMKLQEGLEKLELIGKAQEMGKG